MDSNITINHDLSKPIGDIGRCANYSKAKELLGWEPKITLEELINEMILNDKEIARKELSGK